MRLIRPILAAACLACATVRPARAQTAADTVSLARATARAIAAYVLPETKALVVWRSFDNPLDSAVAENLRDAPEINRRAYDPEHALHIGVRSATIDGDTARVLVETSQHYADGPGMTAFIQRDEYLFQRAAEGWRFVSARNLSIADIGAVRGR